MNCLHTWDKGVKCTNYYYSDMSLSFFGLLLVALRTSVCASFAEQKNFRIKIKTERTAFSTTEHKRKSRFITAISSPCNGAFASFCIQTAAIQGHSSEHWQSIAHRRIKIHATREREREPRAFTHFVLHDKRIWRKYSELRFPARHSLTGRSLGRPCFVGHILMHC